MLPIYVIGLKRSPGSLSYKITERLLDQLKTRDVRFIEAVDTRTNESVEQYKSMVTPDAWSKLIQARETGRRTHHQNLTNGSVGCYLSHLKVWDIILRGDSDIAMVLEEDAYISSMDLLTKLWLPPKDSWDILLLGCIDISPSSSANGWRGVEQFLETHAYLIKKDSIARLRAKMVPINRQIDWELSSHCQKGTLRIFGHFPKVITQNKQAGTSIQNLPTY